MLSEKTDSGSPPPPRSSRNTPYFRRSERIVRMRKTYGESPHSFGSSVGKSILRPIPPLCRKSCLRAAVLIKRRESAVATDGRPQVHGVRRMRRTMPRTGHSCRPSPANGSAEVYRLRPLHRRMSGPRRRFGGLLYKIVRRKFVKAYSVRKEPDIYV